MLTPGFAQKFSSAQKLRELHKNKRGEPMKTDETLEVVRFLEAEYVTDEAKELMRLALAEGDEEYVHLMLKPDALLPSRAVIMRPVG